MENVVELHKEGLLCFDFSLFVWDLNDGAGVRMNTMPPILMTRTTFMRFAVRIALTGWHFCTLRCTTATFSAMNKRKRKRRTD